MVWVMVRSLTAASASAAGVTVTVWGLCQSVGVNVVVAGSMAAPGAATVTVTTAVGSEFSASV